MTKTYLFLLYLKIQFLYIFNKVLCRDLDVRFVSLNSAMVTRGTEIGVFWEVRGCYKIVIENRIIIPGNSHGVNFMFDGSFDNLFITFYGTNKIYSETIIIRRNTVEILNKFEHFPKIPSLIKNSLDKKGYVLKFNNPFKIYFKELKVKNLMTLPHYEVEVTTEIEKVQLEEFKIDNYKP